MRKRILAGLLAGSMIPFPQTVVPAWTAQVVDPTGAPQPGVVVREVWEQYSLESSSHEQDLKTDATGTVSFPRRTLWRPALFNVLGVVRNTLKQGVHASFGPVAYLIAFRSDAQAFADHCGHCRMVLQPLH